MLVISSVARGGRSGRLAHPDNKIVDILEVRGRREEKKRGRKEERERKRKGRGRGRTRKKQGKRGELSQERSKGKHCYL